MRVLDVRPSWDGGKIIAYFDIELAESCRLYGLRLVEVGDGRRLTYAPKKGKRHVATFSADLLDTITASASDAYEARIANERYS